MSERIESQGFYEMLWDCDHCDTKGLLGKTQRHCAECGAKQNPDKRYFPKQGQEQRVDGHKYEGSDRTCPACNAPQSAKAHNCTHCGAPLDGASEVRGVVTPVAPKRKRRWWLVALVIGAVVLIGFGIWYRFIRTRDVQMAVTGHTWERTIAIEEFGELEQQAWRDQMPSDARFASCYRKQRTTKQIPDGEECHTERVDKKDGTFEVVNKCRPKHRSEPVDDDWCSFRVRRWKEVDVTKRSGSGLSPEWPTAGVPPASSEAIGARRPGGRKQTLRLELGNQRCDVDEAVWRKYADGQQVTVEVRASSGSLVCSSL